MPKQKTKARSDSRLCKTVTDPRTGKRKYFYGETQREINKKILEYQTKLDSGRTFGEIADLWWSEAEEDLASQTVGGYRAALKRANENYGDLPIKDIQPKDIQALFKKMALESYAQKTIANQRIVLNQIFNYAIIEGDIQYNPCASVKIPKGTKKTIREPASPEDEARILSSHHPWLFPLVSLLTGLRKGEILALKWGDIDFVENTIEITKSVEHINNKPHIKPPKTEQGNRLVPLLLLLKSRLLPLRGKPEHYVFSDDGGKSPLHKQRYNRLWELYANEVGITCTSHQLRHSYATIAVEEDVNPKDLQNALGHADISTTMNIYAAARKRSVKKVAQKLDAKYSSVFEQQD